MAWFAVLSWASSRPPDDLSLPDLPHVDKLTHLLYFAAGAAATKVFGGAAAVASGSVTDAVALWPPS